MRKIILLSILYISTTSFLFAQTIETGSENPYKNTMRTKGKIIKVSKEGFWVLMMDDISALTLMNNKYSIERYDAKMNLLSTTKLECPIINMKEYDMDYLITSGDDILLLTSYEDKITFKTSLKLFKINKEGSIEKTPVTEWTTDGIKYDKFVVYSPDSSKFAVMLSIIRSRDDKILSMPLLDINKKSFRASNFINYWVFEKEKEVYSKTNIEINHNDLQFMPTQFFLSTKNDLLITTEYESTKTNENKNIRYKCALWKANATTDEVQKITLSPLDAYYFNWNISWANNNSTLDIFGTYNLIDSKDTQGIFFIGVDLEKFSTVETFKTILPEEIFTKVSYSLASKKTLLSFYLNQVYNLKSDTKILVLEYNNSSAVVNRTYYDPNSGSGSSFSSTNNQTRYGDIAFIAIDNEGKIKWVEVIKKETFSYGCRYPESKDQRYFKEYLNFSCSDVDYINSYIPTFNENSVSVFFHDGYKSKDYIKREFAPSLDKQSLPKTLFVKCTFNENGFVESKVILDQSTSENLWRTSMYNQSADGLLIYTESKKSFKWIKVR